MRHQRIHRRTNGTVDMDFYRQRALAERAAVSFRPGKRFLARALIAVAITFAPASAVAVGVLAAVGMVHVITGALQ